MAQVKFKALINLNGQEQEHVVSPIFADMVKFDTIRSRANLPSRTEAEFTFMAVVTYAALIRTGVIPITTDVHAFLDTILGLEPVEDEQEAAEFPVGPTN